MFNDLEYSKNIPSHVLAGLEVFWMNDRFKKKMFLGLEYSTNIPSYVSEIGIILNFDFLNTWNQV